LKRVKIHLGMTSEGGSIMAHAAKRGWQPGRALTLVAGLILAGGVLIAATAAQAPKDKPTGTTKDKPKTGDKAPPEKTQPEKQPGLLKKTITLPKDATSDVVETVDIINKKLDENWKENKIVPADACSDYEFIRRASLDIVGRIAKPDEIAQFMKDPPQYRRTMLIDRLLKHGDYAIHWGTVWTNWLLGRSGTFGHGTYHEQLAVWAQDQFSLNLPHHEFVNKLITAEGKNSEKPEVNFILAHVGEMVPQGRRGEDGMYEMVPITSRITRLFLGVQTQCTQCHDHPFDANLRQVQFWGVNAFLRQVDRKGTPPMPNMRRMQGYPMLELVENKSANKSGVVAYEKRNGVVMEVKAQFLDGTKPGKEVNRRAELARMIGESPNFPKATVNRMWSVFFGKGFCNPIDDFNEQNAVSNPELLAELAAKYKHYGFDNKKLIRWICNSEAYQLSVVANKTNDKQENEVLFSRMMMKALSPEQLFESLMVATQASNNPDAQKEARNGWLDALVTGFGDDEGNEVNFNGTIVQSLMMMNGKEINDAISAKEKGTVSWAMKRSRIPDGVISDLYLVTLNRPPSKLEIARVKEKFVLRPMFASKDKPEAAYQDLLWALLNSNEFMLNH
jgi:hypothetical protein